MRAGTRIAAAADIANRALRIDELLKFSGSSKGRDDRDESTTLILPDRRRASMLSLRGQVALAKKFWSATVSMQSG
jgi:hypothetical protein